MSTVSDTTCPFCGAAFPLGSLACPACDLPLLAAGEPDSVDLRPFDGEGMFENGTGMFDNGALVDPYDSDLNEDARDHSSRRRPRMGTLAIQHPAPRSEYTQGALRCVVVALNQAEAEMLEDMLRSEGIPCMVRRLGLADVPDFLAAGRREVLVPEGALDAARELLRIEKPIEQASLTSATTLAYALIAGIALFVLCVGLIVGFS